MAAAEEAEAVKEQVEGLLARHQQRVAAWEAASAEQKATLDARQSAVEVRFLSLVARITPHLGCSSAADVAHCSQTCPFLHSTALRAMRHA